MSQCVQPLINGSAVVGPGCLLLLDLQGKQGILWKKFPAGNLEKMGKTMEKSGNFT